MRLFAQKDAENFKTNETYLSARKFIDDNYDTIESVEDVCKSVYISRYYLTHLFKDYGGVSPLRYIISKRMEKTKLGNSWSYSILLVCMNLRRGGKSNSEVTSEHSICGTAV